MLKLLSWLLFFLVPSTIKLLHRGVVALLYCDGVRKYKSLGQRTYKQHNILIHLTYTKILEVIVEKRSIPYVS